MNSNTERSNMHVQSSHPVHSVSSSPPERREELLHAHPQSRTQASRPSFNPHRLSHISSSHHFQSVNDPMAYPYRDSSRSSHRYSMGQQIGPDVFRRSYSDNFSSMPPSHQSFQTFNSRDQKRATLQPHPHAMNAQPGTNSNRASRLLEMPKRPNVELEPTNLIHSIRDSPFSNKPNAVAGDSRRVVTGILQSALPPSARPPPVETAPSRSMPIAELQKRHKAALQKLQTHTNQRAAQNSAPSQPKPVKSQQRPTIQAKSGSASDAQQRPPIQAKLGSSSDISSKSEPVDKAGKPVAKSINATSRRSFFSFLGPKEEPKSSKTSLEPIQPKKKFLGKKQKEASPPASKGTKEPEEEEDEDVPLAQLRERRASYNPTSQFGNIRHSGNFEPFNSQALSKSYSVPTDVNKLEDRETLNLEYTASEDSHSQGLDATQRPRFFNSKSHTVGGRNKSASSHLELAGSFHNQSTLPSSGRLTPGLNNPPSWLQADFDLSDEEKHGPRPLIFEDEAKAIRNSKRLWVQ